MNKKHILSQVIPIKPNSFIEKLFGPRYSLHINGNFGKNIDSENVNELIKDMTFYYKFHGIYNIVKSIGWSLSVFSGIGIVIYDRCREKNIGEPETTSFSLKIKSKLDDKN